MVHFSRFTLTFNLRLKERFMATAVPFAVKFPARVILDTTVPIDDGTAGQSRVAVAPSAIQVEALAAGTTASIQSRVDSTLAWTTDKALTNADGAYIHTYAVKRNFVRVLRTGGAGDVKAWAQD